MLIMCPECQKQISDKANICPGCGFPINESQSSTIPDQKIAKKRSKTRKMRLPNGFGRITEIKNRNLRNPYRVMITVGVNDNGRPIGKLLQPKAYFKTYNEAYQALMEYNKSPFDLVNQMTLSELYDLWFKEYGKETSPEMTKSLKSAWNYCHEISSMKVFEIKPGNIKYIMEHGYRINTKGEKIEIAKSIPRLVKILLCKLFDYAIELELVDKNPARMIKNKKEAQNPSHNEIKPHIAYTDDEIELIRNNLNDKVCAFIYIQCYSGWRPSELLELELENIDFDNNIMVGGIKTEYGINRTVPIHSKIKDILKETYEKAKNNGGKYLFDLHYDTFKYNYYKAMKKIGMEKPHKPHDGRVTFVTKAKKYSLDEYAIKRIVGHSIADLTERVYTERSLEWLKEQIELIKE